MTDALGWWGVRRVGAAMVWVVMALLAGSCGGPEARTFAAPSGGGGAPEERCDGLFAVDGAFTEFDEDCVEWSAVPRLKGVYGTFQFAVHDGKLLVINDWTLRDDGPADPDMYNLFQMVCGAEQWEIRVYGNSTIGVWRDGEPYGLPSKGAAGFGPSPAQPKAHTIFEFELTVPPNVTACAMMAADPKNGSFDNPRLALVTEPTIFSLHIELGSELTVIGAVAPALVASDTKAAPPGAMVTFTGANLGQQGALWFGAKQAEVIAWNDEAILAKVPVMSGSTGVRATVGGATTNILPFTVTCAPACDGLQCGDDGCGGSCGTCAPGEQCVANQCQCVPSCAGKTCGDDGCGGSCGACPKWYHCDAQYQCVPDFE